MKKIPWPDYLKDGNPKLNLTRIVAFLAKMGNPETRLPPVFHIAGTNGKGSTTAYIKYILEAEGYLVHRFTSPHLVDLNERIEVSSKVITDDYLLEVMEYCRDFSEKNSLEVSYFEGLFVIAVIAFTRNPAVASVIEVGLGGRLDATNVIPPPLAEIITSISYDHTKILGDTLGQIAGEKAGIIKEGSTLIIDKQPPEAYDVIHAVGLEKHNTIYSCGKEWSVEKLADSFVFRGFGKVLELPLPYLEGDHQIQNAGGAIAALLSQSKIKITDDSIAKGLQNVRWNGRLQNVSQNAKLMQFLPKGAELVLDGAHNEGGAGELCNWIYGKHDDKFNVLIIGVLARKDTKEYIKKLDMSFDFVITTNIRSEEECKPAEVLMDEFLTAGWPNVLSSDNFEEALKLVAKIVPSKKNVRVLIAGSLYLIGEVLEF